MPRLSSERSSLAWLTPSALASCHTRRRLQRVSPESMRPLWLVSSCARASKPFFAMPLSGVMPPLAFSGVASPNSSRPSSIVPLPLRSITTKPSSAATQPVPVLMPSASLSNSTWL